MIDYKPSIAIVDYGLGNLFSIKQACLFVGLNAVITHAREEILAADGVILPGVGAYGDAVDTLRRLDLISVLRDIAFSSKPLVGICLGMQLLMTESYEFGRHKGLDIIAGPVNRFENPKDKDRLLKVPQIGWNRIFPAYEGASWQGTPLQEIGEGEYMYFVHSYIVQPQDEEVILSRSRYGHIDFCSGVRRKNVYAFQFHPERSGPAGLKIYLNLRKELEKARENNEYKDGD